ncbi:CGG triplet repeat-binding protein 1 [Plakobranchus ocellatus]|uniref:CGG triplet repeat-binding protein 1 n=1 Tax=Plakobranchus ocellatus TaxID=259542 RepID=A0AAV4BJN1_9GAST|nr:CGG triplet repeat-binding protein 1 [Plakobranchus ocellatus]
MKKFMTSRAPTKVTPKERQLQFSTSTHVSGDKLFCSTCNVVLDHTRKSTVDGHMTSSKHKSMKTDGRPLKRQRTIQDSQPGTIASEERTELCNEWVSMLCAANIPLSKTDHPAVREFLRKRVVNGGSIPHHQQLQRCYLERETVNRVREVMDCLKGKPVSLSTDEMSDANGRYVLNVLASPLELDKTGAVRPYLLDTVFLDSTNFSTVAAAVIKTVTAFEINYEDIVVINTDNAAYMRKAYRENKDKLLISMVKCVCEPEPAVDMVVQAAARAPIALHDLVPLPGRKEIDCLVCSNRIPKKNRSEDWKRYRYWPPAYKVGGHEI